MNILSPVNVRMPTFETCDEWLPVGVGPVWSNLRCLRRVGIREPNGLRFAALIFADDHRAQVHDQTRLPPCAGFPWDKSLPTLRAFDVFRVNVRSLRWRDAVTAMRAVSPLRSTSPADLFVLILAEDAVLNVSNDSKEIRQFIGRHHRLDHVWLAIRFRDLADLQQVFLPPDFTRYRAVSHVATGGSEPVPGGELHPLKSSASHGALLRQQSRDASL